MSAASIRTKIFGKYDIRGIFGTDLDSTFAYKLGGALARFIGEGKRSRFLVGHDARPSSIPLSNSLIAGLLDADQDVDYLGLASTPRVYWQAGKSAFDCAIAVTASHLPPSHNGFKLCRHGAVPISFENGLAEIEDSLNQMATASGREATLPGQDSLLDDYVRALASYLHCPRPLKAVIDCGGGPVGPELGRFSPLAKGLELIGIGTTPDGTFSRRSANPMDEGALDELRQVVARERAHFGAAFDADGDRIVFVDESGEIVSPDLTTALLAGRLLSLKPNSAIMYDLRSSRIVGEYVESLGGRALKSRVGHSLIKADMRRQQVEFAGELSGHFYWSDLYYTDNAMRTLIELANLLSAEGRPFSELLKPLRKYAESGELNFKVADHKAVMERLEKHYADGQSAHLDGLSIDYPSWWFNVRPSNTESLLRLCVGAANQTELEKKCLELKSIINASPSK